MPVEPRSNTLDQAVLLAPPTGEAYTPTVIGPDGTAYAINDAVLHAPRAVTRAPSPHAVTARGEPRRRRTPGNAAARRRRPRDMAYNPAPAPPNEDAMAFLKLLPALLSILLLFAHGFRDFGPIVLPFVGILAFFLVPQGWVARFFQFILCFGALEWVRMAIFLAIERHAKGEDWLRMALILGATSAFTLWAAILFESPELRDVYPRRSIL